MRIDELKKIMIEHSNQMGPIPGYISNNTVHDILSNGYDSTGKKVLRFKDVDYHMYFVGAMDIVVFDLNKEGKYFIFLEYDKEQEENIAYIENVGKMTANAYAEIQNIVNNKKKEIDIFLESIYDEKLENQSVLVNTFAATK